MSYRDTLYQASYNGASFRARGAEGEYGRRVAVHDYPFRDAAWPEDMGRRPREFTIEGFLVGDDVIAQRDWLVWVCERPGPGVLIHPSHGIVSATLLGLQTRERWNQGRMIELRFRFIEAGARIFPSISIATGDAVSSAADELDAAASDDFLSQAVSALAGGAAIARQAVETVTTWTAESQALAGAATNLFHLSSALPGPFGRYAGGKTGSGRSSVTGTLGAAGSVAAQVGQLIAQGAQARAGVAAAAETVASAARAL